MITVELPNPDPQGKRTEQLARIEELIQNLKEQGIEVKHSGQMLSPGRVWVEVFQVHRTADGVLLRMMFN